MSKRIYFLIVQMALFGCRKLYNPTVVSSPNNYLVVEGVINSGDSTIIRLSRSVNISGKTATSPETNATVVVENDLNTAYSLAVAGTGRYSALLNIDNSRRYRLKITTADGRSYLSDFVTVKTTPPIDTLGYDVSANGMDLYTKTHDPTNNTRYYRWDFVETYIYVSQINTYFKFDKNASIYQSQEVVYRPPAEQIHTCYVTDSSTNVIINSSSNLTQDIINSEVIAHIPSGSEKLYYRYTINVKQYALTAEAYQFWLTIKKNTEQLGGIFDAQPSQLNSNIHCLNNPTESVIGYVSACTVSEKRMFIDNAQLPGWTAPPPVCKPYVITWLGGEGIPNYLSAFIAIPVGPVAAGYDATKRDSTYVVQVGDYDCVDCRYHNPNTTTKTPLFWK